MGLGGNNETKEHIRKLLKKKKNLMKMMVYGQGWLMNWLETVWLNIWN